jgi:hypothetical protein
MHVQQQVPDPVVVKRQISLWTEKEKAAFIEAYKVRPLALLSGQFWLSVLDQLSLSADTSLMGARKKSATSVRAAQPLYH